MNYLDKVNPNIKAYFNILEPNYPTWLNEYINTYEMLKQQYISMTCATIYSDLFDSKDFYSSLDHSIGVALIVWHFTHDKKQTLSGLFHDIATPVFKHCIDYLYGDYMTQESTEDLTTEIIKNSKDIMKLLNRDNILVSEVDNYHLYPIADNDTPFLSADRLEYSLANMLFTYRLLEHDDIKKIYDCVEVEKNEKEEELGFNNLDVALKFTEITTKLSLVYRDNKTRYSMQFISDIVKNLINEGKLTIADLYELKESEVIKLIEESKYGEVFNRWRKAKNVYSSSVKPDGVYFVKQPSKVRYIDPLVNNKRLSSISLKAKLLIEENLKYDMSDYVYLDFDLEEKKRCLKK